MSYLEQLKSENTYQGAPPKHPKGGYGGFGGEGRRHFSEKKAPVAVIDRATATGPRTVTVSGNTDPNRITEATIYQGHPTPEAVDIADAILTHLADQGRPVAEADILAAVTGNETLCRNILARLAVDGIAEYLPGGLYQIPEYPPRPADLPDQCPLATGGPVPAGCRFEARLLPRMKAQGTLPMPNGGCPLRAVCKLGREK
jgi:hypothetical protein